MREWVSPDGRMRLVNGDCCEAMKALPDNSVDSIVTDPPYGLSFMGKKWDYDVPSEDIWRECLRVLKPGGHLLAFAGTRTQHRMAVRIEDAGFEIRDMVSYLYSTNETARQLIETLTPEQLKLLDATFGRDGMLGWGYGSGFPKSANISKMLDKAAGVDFSATPASGVGFMNADGAGGYNVTKNQLTRIGESTEAAKQWDGWGTALKPALEPITVARKPLIGTVAANVLEHGTGAINVDGCRVGTGESTVRPNNKASIGYGGSDVPFSSGSDQGRWPANLIHDGSDEVVGLFPDSKGQQGDVMGTENSRTGGDGTNCYGEYGRVASSKRGDSGSAARFFYCAKASKRDRDEGCEGLEAKASNKFAQDKWTMENMTFAKTQPQRNHHPTVKPTDLMRYLCRLVTPPGGTVLDMFMGSGSTGKAAMLEGFSFIGCELDEDFVEIARARIEHALHHPHECEDERQLDLFATPPPIPQPTHRELF